ncbi:Uncharacterized protein PCOAH_00002350 [Plasmodium coatneyi]|uniref:Pv-fam-d protein n=1 Tax=Plasmodium coatneyi TaxID=208452 RepID=A0A1B1DTS2_9APIC|nr:Uncharacterized protein PCOAH_00002350 [Plasmodium coatneyi]ANQ05985.1 Uncharacterized protein PCOAH_00002350 [Plasmodium coatneyi]
MREKTKKLKLFLSFIILALLICTWNYPDKDTSPGEPHGQVNQSSSSLHVRTSRLLRVDTKQDGSPKYAFLRESIKQLVNEDGANFERKLISLLRDHNIDNNFSTSMKSDDAPKYTDPVQLRKTYKKVSHSLKNHNNCNSSVEGCDLYDFYDDDDDDNNYRDSEETLYDKDASKDIHSVDDSKYDYAHDRAYGALKKSDSYRKGRRRSKYENTHGKELYKSRDTYRGLKYKHSRNGLFSSFFKFLKSADTMYEKELMKLMTYDRSSSQGKKISPKHKMYFNILSPLLAPFVLVLVSIAINYPLGVVLSFVLYFIIAFYVLYKTMNAAKKCSFLDKIKKKRRSELSATRR